MIYGFSPSIEQENMNTWGKKDEDINLRNIRNFVGNCITNKNLRIKNRKFNQILKSKYGNLHEFQEKSRKKKILEKLKDLVQLLKSRKNAKPRENTLGLKEFVRHLKEIYNSFKIEITRHRNLKEECKPCDLITCKMHYFIRSIYTCFSVDFIDFCSVILVLYVHFRYLAIGDLYALKWWKNTKNGKKYKISTVMTDALLSWRLSYPGEGKTFSIWSTKQGWHVRETWRINC